MINGVDNLGAGKLPLTGANRRHQAPPPAPASPIFLSKSVDEVSKLQQDASQAVENIATGKNRGRGRRNDRRRKIGLGIQNAFGYTIQIDGCVRGD